MRKVIGIITVLLIFTVSSCKKTTKIIYIEKELPSITLLSPVNGVHLPASTSSVELKWKINGGNIKTYTFEILSGNEPSSLTTAVKGLTSTSYNLAGLKANETYYWEVILHYKDSFTRSTLYRFHINTGENTPPTSPQLLSPINGDVVAEDFITLQWKKASDPDGDTVSYKLYWGSDPTNLKEVEVKESTLKYKLTNLVNHTTYYWKVIAIDSKGGKSASPLFKFSTSFTIKRFIDASLGADNVWRADTFTNHVCAIDSEGQLWCWGANAAGELGLGHITDKDYYICPGIIEPPQKVALPEGLKIKSVSMGINNGCAIDQFDNLWCWGANNYGQLGDPDIERFAYIPIRIENADNSGWKEISTYKYHTCGIDDNGFIWCWGDNYKGETGWTKRDIIPTPTKVAYSNWIDVQTGLEVTCALNKDGDLYCWGSNSIGILANDTISTSNMPILVNNADRTKWKKFSLRYQHICGIDENNNLWCWGENQFGQSGVSPTINPVRSPTKVFNPDNTPWKDVALGRYYTCGVDINNNIWCWFPPPIITMKVFQYSSYPVKLTSPGGIKKTIGGTSMGCIINNDDKLLCMGIRDFGSFADNFFNFRVLQPEKVANPAGNKWIKVVTGNFNTCALDETGILWCWGGRKTPIGNELPTLPSNNHYYLTQYLSSQMVPYPVSNVKWSSKISHSPVNSSVDSYHKCAIDQNNNLWCWGRNDHGQIGIGTNNTPIYSPTEITYPAGISWIDVDTGLNHTCAIDSNNNAWCWGDNDYGQLSALKLKDYLYPTRVSEALVPLKKITLGNNFSCALDINGYLWCWGDNSDHIITGPSIKFTSHPTPVSWVEDKKFKDISAGSDHICGITVDNELLCWGDNSKYQLGVTNVTYYPVIVTAGDNTKWLSVYAAGANTCALAINGELWCWGDNKNYQLGFDPHNDYLYTTPVLITKINEPISSFSIDPSHACVVTTTGKLFCWGSSKRGEIGTNYVPTFKVLTW